jgi:3-oxoacyl-[acyl-carrier protein] reductase
VINTDLTGKSAIVTGSAKRNGRAIALALADAGASVVINARESLDDANAVSAEIRRRGGQAVVCMADVTRPADVQRLVGAAVNAFGSLDILVNNAATRTNDRFADMDLAKWHAVTSVILDGAFLCALTAAPHLQRSGHGRIVNIGGVAGHRGARGRIHVVSAKAGLVGLTKALALELAPKVTVNCVVPGRIEDEADSPEALAEANKRVAPESIPLARSGTTRDIAAAVAFLCSENASYVTGQALHVNGGMYLC